jgi:hypothetical protein
MGFTDRRIPKLKPTGIDSFKLYLAIADAEITTGDPLMNPETVYCPSAITGNAYKNVQVWDLGAMFPIPEEVAILSVYVWLHWWVENVAGGGATIDSVWSLGATSDVNGGNMTAGHEITDPQNTAIKAGLVEVDKRIGQAKLAGEFQNGVSPCKLYLSLKSDDGATEVRAAIQTDSYIEVCYSAGPA